MPNRGSAVDASNAGRAQRIVSLLASATEIVCALGAGDRLVGRSHECDNPPSVRDLPACSAPAFDVSVSSGAIDAEVRRRLRAGEPLYRIRTERIAALRPDLLLTQTHCDVCAVTPADLSTPAAACALSPRQVAISAFTLDDIFAGILQVADALELHEQGERLVRRERGRLAAVRARTAGLAPPSAVLLEWTDPLFAMGNWGPELVEIAGGNLRLGHQGQYSTTLAAERLQAADPDFLIVAPCGFGLARSLAELPNLARLPFWHSLRAVRSGRVAFADGNLFFNRSGMTVSRTAEILAEILHGLQFADSELGQWQWMHETPQAPAPQRSPALQHAAVLPANAAP